MQTDVIAALDAANGDSLIAAEYLLGVIIFICFYIIIKGMEGL